MATNLGSLLLKASKNVDKKFQEIENNEDLAVPKIERTYKFRMLCSSKYPKDKKNTYNYTWDHKNCVLTEKICIHTKLGQKITYLFVSLIIAHEHNCTKEA